MSYYQRHVFFCVNQREAGAVCCNNHGAQAMRDYAKERVKALKLDSKSAIATVTAHRKAEYIEP